MDAVARLELLPDEVVNSGWPAIWHVNRIWTRGGRLLLTNERVYFAPWIRTKNWSCLLAEVSFVTIRTNRSIFARLNNL